MTRPVQPRTIWWLVVVFAIAMAWLESATVYYLRVLVDRIDPYQANPLPFQGGFEAVELVREASTMVMLLAIGALAGRTWRTGLGYTAIAFGVWDIFYYIFLKVMTGWPASLLDWDILFLLPLPWWGPVLAPMCIAVLMVVMGSLASQTTATDQQDALRSSLWPLTWLGVALALYVFMADALGVVDQGLEATKTVLPQAFNWGLFVVALALMASPVAQIAWRMRPGVLRYHSPEG